jgi:hypothetical protein
MTGRHEGKAAGFKIRACRCNSATVTNEFHVQEWNSRHTFMHRGRCSYILDT